MSTAVTKLLTDMESVSLSAETFKSTAGTWSRVNDSSPHSRSVGKVPREDHEQTKLADHLNSCPKPDLLRREQAAGLEENRQRSTGRRCR